MSTFDRYVGIPYKELGSSFRGVDCHGLVRLVWREERSVDFPAYGLTWSRDPALCVSAVQEAKLSGHWPEVAEPATFDVVVMRSHFRDQVTRRLVAAPMHLGLFVSPGLVLHADNRPSRLDKIEDLKVVGIHRYVP